MRTLCVCMLIRSASDSRVTWDWKHNNSYKYMQSNTRIQSLNLYLVIRLIRLSRLSNARRDSRYDSLCLATCSQVMNCELSSSKPAKCIGIHDVSLTGLFIITFIDCFNIGQTFHVYMLLPTLNFVTQVVHMLRHVANLTERLYQDPMQLHLYMYLDLSYALTFIHISQ